MTTAPIWLVLGVLGVQGTCRGTCGRCWIQSGHYFILFYFTEGDFILSLCSVSSLQYSGRRNWTAARDLQRYRNHYPVRAPGPPPHHFYLQEHFLDLGASFCLCIYRLSTFKGFICEGEGMMCVWVHQKQAATSQSTFRGFSLKCVGNVRESKEKCWEWLLLFKRLLLVHFLFSSPGFERTRKRGGRRDVELKLL